MFIAFILTQFPVRPYTKPLLNSSFHLVFSTYTFRIISLEIPHHFVSKNNYTPKSIEFIYDITAYPRGRKLILENDTIRPYLHNAHKKYQDDTFQEYIRILARNLNMTV